MAMPPRGLRVWVSGPDDLLAGGFAGFGGFFGEGAAGDGDGRAIDILAFEQALRDHADAAGLIDVRGHVLAARLDIHEDGRARQDRFEIVDGEGELGLARHGEEMQHGVGGAGGTSDARDGIVEGGAGADVARQDVVAHGVHDDFAAAEGDAVLALVDLRHGGGAHGGESDQLHDGGHGVGGELSAASAGAGAGVVLDIEEVGIAESCRGRWRRRLRRRPGW